MAQGETGTGALIESMSMSALPFHLSVHSNI